MSYTWLIPTLITAATIIWLFRPKPAQKVIDRYFEAVVASLHNVGDIMIRAYIAFTIAVTAWVIWGIFQ